MYLRLIRAAFIALAFAGGSAHASPTVNTPCAPRQAITAVRTGTLIFYNQFLQEVARRDVKPSKVPLNIPVADCDAWFYYIEEGEVRKLPTKVSETYLGGRVAVKAGDVVVKARAASGTKGKKKRH